MSDAENGHRKALKAAEAETQTLHEYWRQSLGGYLVGAPESRTIEAHAQWLSDCTVGLASEMDTARAIIAAIAKWKADATVAQTLGIAEPSVLTYLPAGLSALQAEQGACL